MSEKLIDIRSTERKSQYKHHKFTNVSIMQDSMLTVHVIDGQECCSDRMISPAIKLAVSDHVQTTKVCRPTNEPVWDEDFFFDIKTG